MFGGKKAQNKAAKPEEMSSEEKLIQLHSSLIEFYSTFKPENLDNDVLIILMQFFIDNGEEALNFKLRNKYGEDLKTFKNSAKTKKRKPAPELPVLKHEVRPSKAEAKKKKAEKRAKRRTGQRTRQRTQIQRLSDPRRSLPPLPKKDPESQESIRESLAISKRKSRREMTASPPPEKVKNSRKPKLPPLPPHQTKNKKVNLELINNELSREDTAADYFEPDLDDPKLRLTALDAYGIPKLKPRDLIEAFYSKYDEKKLDLYRPIENFVTYVDQEGLKALSNKILAKYGEGLEDDSIVKLARRRRILENILTDFYKKHDPPKINTRWSVLKIVNWTMERGLVDLNRKFKQKYNVDVIDLS